MHAVICFHNASMIAAAALGVHLSFPALLRLMRF